MGLLGLPSIPAPRISHCKEEAGKPSSGQLHSQQGPGAGMQAGDLTEGYQADQCLGRPLSRSVQPGLPELLNSTPSALSDPLFKFSACLALHKIISIHLFLVLALRHYSLQELSARLTDAPISTQSCKWLKWDSAGPTHFGSLTSIWHRLSFPPTRFLVAFCGA